MQIEFEATFARVDKDAVRSRLRGVGARLVQPEYLMKRAVFHPPVAIDGGWLRVRQEADKVTMSLKIVNGTNIENQHEVQLEVNSLEAGVTFLEALGAKQKSYQENLRELWMLEGGEITIDTWPGLAPCVEVEGTSEAEVRRIAEHLGFAWGDALFCEVSTLYNIALGIPVEVMRNAMPVITFEQPPQRYGG